MRVIIAAIILFIPMSSVIAQDYYKSNILGMKLEKIEPEEADNYEYFLIYSKTQESEDEVLYNYDKKVFERNTIYENGIVIVKTEKQDNITETVKKRNGLVIFNETADPEKTEKTEYTYNKKKLEKSSLF